MLTQQRTEDLIGGLRRLLALQWVLVVFFAPRADLPLLVAGALTCWAASWIPELSVHRRLRARGPSQMALDRVQASAG
ncbi:MAG: hypothetical protein AAFZ18_39635 [Myxococcota bacterium]